ncbi:MAG: nucleoside monophosphate kinase [Candidatus Bathyarchaeota archaeon]|nr:nucleoside monophosphate kinase [Candidatus Bathyarchaeota archaeon]
MKAIIFGAPGAGKGTYSSRLQTKFNLDVISTGDIFRELIKGDSELGMKVRSFVEKGALVPDSVVTEVLKDRLSKIPEGKGFMLDGYPRTIEQTKSLAQITKLDVVIQLDVPDWIIIERLTSRRQCKNCGAVYNVKFLKPKVEGVCDKCGGPLYQRADDTEEVIKNRLQVYANQTKPLVEYFKEQKIPFVIAVTKSLDQPPEPIVEDLVVQLKQLNIS